MPMLRPGPRVALSIAVALAFPACQTTGPNSIADGRALYNDVITRTGDEQVLGMIVKHRYDETFGMLDVASVTAQVSVGVNSAINLRAGADSDDTEGNLVPFAAGISYEESPTISYVPMSGEVFMTRLVAPVSLAQTLTLGRLNRVPGQTFSLMVNRINGLSNTPAGGEPTPFQRVGELLTELQTIGVAQIVGSGESYYLALNGYDGASQEQVRALLERLRLTAFEADGRELLIPIRLGVGTPPQGDAIVLETRSVLDLVRMIGDRIEVPSEHIASGFVGPVSTQDTGAEAFIRIRSALERPESATVAVAHRGWWFYIDASDIPSKRDFVLLRAVISMGIEGQPEGVGSPVLTIPVSG
ncbi:MAG TPA: hypothetical protein VFD43_10585 [Planctomycetota bacterium]|nr:hypothetical protein [Planctomycetota bacterium]